MAKRLLLLPLFALLSWQWALACDACGCSIGGNGIGLLGIYRTNFVGLGWQTVHFQSAPRHGAGSEDYFHTLELSVRYHLSDRFKVLVYQPYRLNHRLNSDGSDQRLDGMSDTRILGSYTVFQNQMLGSQTSLFLEIGAGLKLPVGAYNPHIHDTNLPENFNIGNGSWGYIIQPSLVLTHQKVGIVLNGIYQHHSRTELDYRFGHQLTGQLLFFAEAALNDNLKFIPNAGLTLEQITDDRYANDKPVSGTGGNGTFFSAGLNVKLGNWMIGTAASLPLEQSYSNGEVDAGSRLSAQISFTF